MLSVLPLILGSVGAAGLTGIYYATYGVRSQWLGRTVWCGRSDAAAVAITFDDGPSEATAAVLDTLAEHGVKAAFFVIGQQVAKHPHLARRIVNEGHELGNHSYSHPIYLYKSSREIKLQLERTQKIIFDTTGVRPRISRPPCGVRTVGYFRAAQELDLQTINWSVAGIDWKTRSPQAIAERVLQRSQPGSIILLHDGDSQGRASRQATVDSLPLIFNGLRFRKLSVKPLRSLCGIGSLFEENRCRA